MSDLSNAHAGPALRPKDGQMFESGEHWLQRTTRERAAAWERQRKWDLRHLNVCREIASWSKDPNTQVGARIVNGMNRVLGEGYNGFPYSMVDLPENYENREQKYSRIVHAEINALISANTAVAGATLYTWPFMPCDRCVVQMLQAGIARFVAPIADAERLVRWGAAFEKTRAYIRECGAHLTEIDISER